MVVLDIPKVDVIIVGGGSSALMAAISLYPLKVLIVSDKTPESGDTASHWSKGGIAAAVGHGDEPKFHYKDTVDTSCGIADNDSVSMYVESAPSIIDRLVDCGVSFDLLENGEFYLGREGAHGKNRVLTSGRDSFGKELMRALTAKVRQANNVVWSCGLEVISLISSEIGIVSGVTARCSGGEIEITARAVLLATGGIGGLYSCTTNPNGVNGLGLAMAAEVGADLVDLEFVQFHPTSVDCDIYPSPMISEALRGAGAIIVNSSGERFLSNYHEKAELAPRDVVSRAMYDQMQKGENIYMDARSIISKFPSARDACERAGLDPLVDLIPVVPAAHYHMGGVYVDAKTGGTSVSGLWACGEVSCSGFHGANRLASNSLLEALVSGRVCASSIMEELEVSRCEPAKYQEITFDPCDIDSEVGVNMIRSAMSLGAGIIRNNKGLTGLIDKLNQVCSGEIDRRVELMALSAKLIASAALNSKCSIGSHYRSDYLDACPSDNKKTFKNRITTLDKLIQI